MLTISVIETGQVQGIKQEAQFVIPAPAHRVVELVAPRDSWYLPAKTGIEWLIALTLLVLTAPLMLVLAFLVKLTSAGPAFYAQTRLGRHGKAYKIFKLRSMVNDAEVGTGPVWAAKNDRRITAIGTFMRDTHLDELPQLWNVLRGEMSLIGPRPERPEIAARIERRVPQFRNRLAVRPGVTGLAQMLVPADDPDDNDLRGLRMKLAHDLYYVNNLSVRIDLRIAFSTPCYFLAAAVDALRRATLRSYGAAVSRGLVSFENEGPCEQAA